MHNAHVVVFDFKWVSTAVVVFLELIWFTCKEDMTENFQLGNSPVYIYVGKGRGGGGRL